MSRVTPYPGFPAGPLARGSHFQAIARSITFQQLAGAAARTIYGRVCELTPGPRFPAADECLSLPDHGLSERRPVGREDPRESRTWPPSAGTGRCGCDPCRA